MRYCTTYLVLALLAINATCAVAANPIDPATLDQQLADVLKDVHNRGANLHNVGDTVGCYRMYQGALFAIKPLLSYRPDTQKSIDEGLRFAETQPMTERARALHATFAAVRNQLKPPANSLPMPTPVPNAPPKVSAAPASSPAPAMPAPILPPPGSVPSFGDTSKAGPGLTTSLWDRVGGQAKVEKIIDECIQTAAEDHNVNLTRDGKFKLEGEVLAAVKRKFVGYLSFVSDGTVPYTGRTMKDAHRGMNIKADEWTAFVGHLKKAMENQKVSETDVQSLLKKLDESKADIMGETPK